MMRSMFSGVSGLKVHQTKMDVIGNNIANVNTVGYKAQRVTFNEVFSQTLQGASAANDDTGRGGVNAMQVGLGVNVSSIDMLMTQGATERTDNPFDLMINGSGFIVVGDSSGQYFTRNGALRVDDSGNLCIPNGMMVQGWMAQPNDKQEYEIVRGQVQGISLAAASTSNPKATTSATMTGNLSATEDEPQSTTVSFYDSIGNYYKASIEFTKAVDATGKVTYSPAVKQVTDQDGNELRVGDDPAFEIATTSIEFDKEGEIVKPNGTDPVKFSITPKQGTIEVYDPEEGKVVGTYTAAAPTVEVDATKLTQYASKTTITTKSNGNSAGTMSGYSIGADGIITATYTNGDQRVVAQVCVAEFDNPTGLEKVGENLFTVTANSGEFDGVGVAGSFNTGCLEMSNVDLSSEFTQMITTQRGFQANSRIITVSDEMLQELTNLKR